MEGKGLLEAYCAERGIPLERVGKLVVAVERAGAACARRSSRRGRGRTGCPGLETLDEAGIREREPHAVGLRALLSPTTGIVDYRAVAVALADDVRSLGGAVFTGTRCSAWTSGSDEVVVTTPSATISLPGRHHLCRACGPMSWRPTAASRDPERIVPFRGRLLPAARRRARHGARADLPGRPTRAFRSSASTSRGGSTARCGPGPTRSWPCLAPGTGAGTWTCGTWRGFWPIPGFAGLRFASGGWAPPSSGATCGSRPSPPPCGGSCRSCATTSCCPARPGCGPRRSTPTDRSWTTSGWAERAACSASSTPRRRRRPPRWRSRGVLAAEADTRILDLEGVGAMDGVRMLVPGSRPRPPRYEGGVAAPHDPDFTGRRGILEVKGPGLLTR